MANEQIQKLRERVDKDPKSTLFVPLAEEYRKAGQVDEAIEVLKTGIERQPTYMSARVSLGKIYLAQNMMGEAREEFEKVVKAIPDNLFAHKKLAEIYREAGELDNAINAYRTVLSLSPLDEESQAILQGLETGEISVGSEQEQPVDAAHQESEEEARLEEEEFIGEEVMPVERVHEQTPEEREEGELVLSLADKDALEEEEGEAKSDEREEALGPASVSIMDVIHEEPEEPKEDTAEKDAPVEEAEVEAEVPAGVGEEPADVVAEEAEPVEEVEPEAEGRASPEEGMEEEPVGVVEIPDEESFSDIDIKGFEEDEGSESADKGLTAGEESSVTEGGIPVAAELQPATGDEEVSGEETGVARADRLILEEDYGGAFAVYRGLLAENPDDKSVIQKMEELRSLLRLLGRERDIHIARLESFIDAVKRRKDELYRNA